MCNILSNILLPSCLKPLFQSEAKYETIDQYKNVFYSHPNRTRFLKKDFALSLVFHPLSAIIRIQILQTDLHALLYRISCQNLFKDQIIFS